MSKYKEISTEIKRKDSLIKALEDLGIEFEISKDGKANVIPLVSHWSSGTTQNVAVAIQRDKLSRFVGGNTYDGLGFKWNGSGYELIADHYDTNSTSTMKKINQIKQRYAFHEVKRQARIKGYNVREIQTSTGVIRLQLVGR